MKNVILTPNPYRDRSFQYALTAQKILREVGVGAKICLPFQVDHSFELPKNLHLSDMQQSLRDAELLICMGGDGTILHASKLAASRDIPVLGVNVGKLGFIAELEASELHLLKKLKHDDYTIEERMMLHVEVRRAGEVLMEDLALNDAAVTKGAVARVIQLTVSYDGTHAYSTSGDGVLIATPTGSTAYSMAAGGPVVEPTAKNLIVTPICAHDLQVKSFVLSRNREVSVQIGPIGRKNAYLSVDGGKAFRLNAGDLVVAKTADTTTKLLRLKNTSFYENICQKFSK